MPQDENDDTAAVFTLAFTAAIILATLLVAFAIYFQGTLR